MTTCRCDDLAAQQIAQVCRDGGGTDIDREAIGRSCSPAHTPMICLPPCTATVTCHAPVRNVGLQHLQHRQIAGQILKTPLRFQRLEEPPQSRRKDRAYPAVSLARSAGAPQD